MVESILQAMESPVAIALFAVALICFCAAARLLYLLHQREKKADDRLRQARVDIADMTILFQTMRDIIGQQKKLAKDFNEELEHKMGQVKHILNQGMEKNKQLYEKQQRIATELEESQAQIDAIFRQIGQTRNRPVVTERPPPPPPEPVPEPSRPEEILPPARPIPQQRVEPAPSRLGNGVNGNTPRKPLPDILPPRRPQPAARPQAAPLPADAARLADTGVTKASFTHWVAEDLATTPKEPIKRNILPEPPSEPPEEASASNGDTAREAFRALLNMPQEADMRDSHLDLSASMPIDRPGTHTADEEEPDNGNSKAMQQRVLEYSEAGMTVAEVSKELGIGKGEVRLMLSLAKQSSGSHSA